jgi:hypothetical protein
MTLEALPNEIVHLIGEFSYEDSLSSTTPSSIENSAVYFYFHTLAYLSTTMYFKTHNSDFWETHPLHIVLRNRDLLEMYGTNTESSVVQSSNNNEEEELIEEDTNNAQLLYVHHLIETCQFAHIEIVGQRYSMFVNDLLRLLYVKSPQALQKIKTLGITCNVLSLQNDLLPIVLSQCHSLKRLKVQFVVGSKVKSDLNNELTAEYNSRITAAEYNTIPLKRLSVISSGTRYNEEHVLYFIASLARQSSIGLSRLYLQRVVPNEQLLQELANYAGHSLKYFSMKQSQSFNFEYYTHFTIKERILADFAIKCQKLVSFEMNVGSRDNVSLDILQTNTVSTLKTLGLELDKNTYWNDTQQHEKFQCLEELIIGLHGYYDINPVQFKILLENMCSNGTLQKLTLIRAPTLSGLDLSNALANLEELTMSRSHAPANFPLLISSCTKLKKLTCTDWNNCDFGTLAFILQSREHLTSIDIASVYFAQDTEDTVMQLLANNAGPNLKHFGIRFSANLSQYQEKKLSSEQLELLQNIQSLSIIFSNTSMWNFTLNLEQYLLPNLQELHLVSVSMDSSTFSLLTQKCTLLKNLTVSLKDVGASQWNICVPFMHLRKASFRNPDTLSFVLAIYLACPTAYSISFSNVNMEVLTSTTIEELEELSIEPDEYVAFSHMILKVLPDVLNILTYLNETGREEMKQYMQRFVSRSHLENIRHDFSHQSGPDYHLAKLFIQFKAKLNEYLDQSKSFSSMFF